MKLKGVQLNLFKEQEYYLIEEYGKIKKINKEDFRKENNRVKNNQLSIRKTRVIGESK